MNAAPSCEVRRCRVLVVDDNPSVLRSLEFYLPGIGFDVVSAGDGHSALRLAAEGEVQLILLDVDMPGMNGFAVCRALRADPVLRWLPVVMMTGRSSREVTQEGLAAGARAVLAKPFDFDLLESTLNQNVAAPPEA